MGWLARPWHRLRREIGLPPAADLNPLTEGHSPGLHVAPFSKSLLDRQPDWPPQTVVTGFPWYDQPGSAGMPPMLARFLDTGPPPIVFTLGTALATDARTFYETSARAARALGRRAVLILMSPRNRPPSLPEEVVAFDYAPFSELFPRAAAVVHTAGSALRVWQCARGAPCWSCPARGTNRTTPSARLAWASPARFRGTATPQLALPPNCTDCSTTPRTRGGHPQSVRKCGKRTECGLLATPSQGCHRVGEDDLLPNDWELAAPQPSFSRISVEVITRSHVFANAPQGLNPTVQNDRRRSRQLMS